MSRRRVGVVGTARRTAFLSVTGDACGVEGGGITSSSECTPSTAARRSAGARAGERARAVNTQSRAASVCGTRETSPNLSRIFAFTRFRTTVGHKHRRSEVYFKCTLISCYTYCTSHRGYKARRARVAGERASETAVANRPYASKRVPKSSKRRFILPVPYRSNVSKAKVEITPPARTSKSGQRRQLTAHASIQGSSFPSRERVGRINERPSEYLRRNSCWNDGGLVL